MAIWFNDTTPYSPTHQNQYYMDGDSSIEDLPTLNDGAGKGSMAFHLGTGQMSVLGSNGQWSVMRSGGGSGSSGSGSGSNTSGLNVSYYELAAGKLEGTLGWLGDPIDFSSESIPIVILNDDGQLLFPISAYDDNAGIIYQYFFLGEEEARFIVIEVDASNNNAYVKVFGKIDFSDSIEIMYQSGNDSGGSDGGSGGSGSNPT